MVGWYHGIIDLLGIILSKLWGNSEDREAWHAAVHGVTKGLTPLSAWKLIPKK